MAPGIRMLIIGKTWRQLQSRKKKVQIKKKNIWEVRMTRMKSQKARMKFLTRVLLSSYKGCVFLNEDVY